jgi:hypothetical protein
VECGCWSNENECGWSHCVEGLGWGLEDVVAGLRLLRWEVGVG